MPAILRTEDVAPQCILPVSWCRDDPRPGFRQPGRRGCDWVRRSRIRVVFGPVCEIARAESLPGMSPGEKVASVGGEPDLIDWPAGRRCQPQIHRGSADPPPIRGLCRYG